MGIVTACQAPPANREREKESVKPCKPKVFDIYEFGPLLGSGTFGQVRACWLTSESDTGQYAMKVVDSHGEVFRNAPAYLSARQEADVLQSVRHPHIVELIDVFDEDQWIFMILERISGGELFSAIGNPLLTAVTEATIGMLGQQLMQALQHLHARSIMHRDVKAENVLLTTNPLKTGLWHIKLIDFGLAARLEQQPATIKLFAERTPAEDCICGTAYYCAPEVWVQDYGPKVDVWAAGVVLYLALHGTFPYLSKDPDLLESIICDPARAPSFMPVCGRECPGYEATQEARQCLNSLLAKDPGDRPSAGRALLEQLWLKPRGRAVTGEVLDQYVPVPVRLRAARAAARPPVSEALEKGRTQALQQLRAQAEARRSDCLNTGSPTRNAKPGVGDDTTRCWVLRETSWESDSAAGSDVGLRSSTTVGGPYLSDSEIEEKPVTCLERCPGPTRRLTV